MYMLMGPLSLRGARWAGRWCLEHACIDRASQRRLAFLYLQLRFVECIERTSRILEAGPPGEAGSARLTLAQEWLIPGLAGLAR